MIYAAEVNIPAGNVIEVFATLGVDVGRYQVTLQGATQPLELSQDSGGTSSGPSIPTAGFTGSGDTNLQFVTDKDPVYVKCVGGSGTGSLYVALTAA